MKPYLCASPSSPSSAAEPTDRLYLRHQPNDLLTASPASLAPVRYIWWRAKGGHSLAPSLPNVRTCSGGINDHIDAAHHHRYGGACLYTLWPPTESLASSCFVVTQADISASACTPRCNRSAGRDTIAVRIPFPPPTPVRTARSTRGLQERQRQRPGPDHYTIQHASMDKFDGLRPTGPGIKVALHPDTQIAKEESLQEPGRPALPCSPVRHQHLHLRHPSHARAPGPFRARWSLIPVPLSPPAGDRPSAASRAVVCVCVWSAPLAVCVRGRPPSARASVPVCRDHPGTRGTDRKSVV